MKAPKNRNIIRSTIIIAVIISVGAIYFMLNQEDKSVALLGDVHEHFDIAVYLNGEKLDLAQEKYMSNSERALSNFMHLHDMDGEIVHKHIDDVDMGFFFFTVGMKFNSSCIVTDDGAEYCSDETNELRMFVNGIEEPSMNEYEPNDLDRILITYGSVESGETIIKDQIQSVTDRACIQSGQCPERGDPSAEYSCLSTEGYTVEGP